MCSMCENCSLFFAICRIGCYKCCQKIKGKQPDVPRPVYSVLMIGLSQAGKSVLLARLGSESTDDIKPTQGFSVKPVQLPHAILDVKELGGGDGVRKYWQHYYDGSQGVIFVVDSTSSEEDLELAAAELQSALSHPALRDLPLLVLANKQDEKEARSVEKLEELLDLKTLARNRQWLIKPCSIDKIDDVREALSSFVEKITGPVIDTQPDNRL
ncbi:ADP-ribosylation factor-like protein 15 [Actinia tenebrosa]|uniref:ADP-ribosylation factor-like protein 15 n=1 Tax=Actinia tenebrosa TaxID=6105 RepID=A0A6P8HZP5_ACTTE|nr:ADP-ribosylation factor-like protein 15 [Actinia tenebrosa]